MKIAVIDNYDSFTYNLVHLARQILSETGGESTLEVFRNDRFRLEDLAGYDKLLLSPGPGIPEEAGLLVPVIERYAPCKSILGVCLGHQAIGQMFGARLQCLSQVFHGVATETTVTAPDPIFEGLPQRFTTGRYHSWVVERGSVPDCLEVTAESAEGLVMALRHRSYDVHGIQFHPESVLTPQGSTIMRNWLKL